MHEKDPKLPKIFKIVCNQAVKDLIIKQSVTLASNFNVRTFQLLNALIPYTNLKKKFKEENRSQTSFYNTANSVFLFLTWYNIN